MSITCSCILVMDFKSQTWFQEVIVLMEVSVAESLPVLHSQSSLLDGLLVDL